MADTAISFLLDNLKQLALTQHELISNAKDDLDGLKVDLELMKAVLEDSASMAHKEEVFKVWERQIRDLVYEAEDIVDSWVIDSARSKQLTLGTKRLKLAKEVKSLREKINPKFNQAQAELNKFRNQEKVPDATAEQTIDKIRKPRKAETIVGFEDVTDKLIEWLTQELEELEAISVVGMAGLGKTTVAWKIFNHPKIKYEFPTRIWVSGPQELDKKAVLLAILKEFTQQDLSSKTNEELAILVSEKLERGKFLIVLDDVWTTQEWDDVKTILPISNGTSKVLITTRAVTVAQRANLSREPYKLRFLNKDESWELLQLEVFGKLHMCPRHLEDMGKRIAKQCDGLPLSIVVIGGILFDIYSAKRLASEWDKVSQNLETYLIHGDKKKSMENIIMLSYTKLPYELRDCFLYLGMFPEDTEIPTWKLIQLWIAEGFIREHPGKGKNLEEIAEDILMDFINRNLVMVGKAKSDGDTKTVRVHDTIREFCRGQAAKDKMNLFEEIKMSGVFIPPVSDIQGSRRLCIHSHVEAFLQKKPKALKARTFLCFAKSGINLKKADIQSFMDIFKLLRVLDANAIKFPVFPSKLTNLIHLRYITLCGDEFKLIPKAMSELSNLQTLVVDTTKRELEVDAELCKMLQLRHFKSKASIILKRLEGKGKGGENLHTLTRLSPASCTENFFGKAKNLTTLGIRGRLENILDADCFKQLLRLKELKFMNDVYPDSAVQNPLKRLPDPTRFPPNLRSLTLSHTCLDWRITSTLGQLENLEVLKLKENAFMGATWNAKGGGFDKLEVLHIERTDLVFWRVPGMDSPFPKLRILVLKNCEKLQEIPEDSFGNSQSLQILSVERVTKYAVASARKIEEARKKMQEHRADWGGFKLLIAPGDE